MARRHLAALVILAAAAPASAQEESWWREDFDNGIQVAITDNANDAIAAVRCVDGALNMFFQIRQEQLDPALKAGDGTVDLTLRIDDDEDLYWARTSLFVSIDGYVAADYTGRDARLWAEEIAGASRSIEVGFTMNAGATVDTQYNVQTFDASGSTATANEILALCGK